MRWIVDEVDDLISVGVISTESGAALRRHYEQKLAQEESGSKTLLLSVLGAALIGAGVILIIAHNWDDLGRPARTALSLLPLLVGFILSLWTLLKRAGSTAWREGAGVAHCAGVAASIALVSQTYHISGELSDFLFTWLLLILPLPYLLRAVMPALIYLAGIAVWAMTVAVNFGGPHGSSDGYWLFLAAILPFCWAAIKQDRLGKVASWISAFVGISALFGLGFTSSHTGHELWIPAFAGLLGVEYFAGVLLFPERRYTPLRVIGGFGAGFLGVLLAFKGIWPCHPIDWAKVRWLEYGLAIGFPLASLAFLARAVREKADFNGFAAALPIVAWVAFGIFSMHGPNALLAAALVFTAYTFVLALGTVFRGLKQRAVATLNGGLLILMALMISRFVDSEFSILARGLAFVILGSLILAANLWLLKTKREAKA